MSFYTVTAQTKSGRWIDVYTDVPSLSTANKHATKLRRDPQWQTVKVVKQGTERFWSNPMLAIFGNPPMGRSVRSRGETGRNLSIHLTGGISHEAHKISYKHVHNGKLYEHEFETPVSLLTATMSGKRVVIIVGDDDMWDDYPDES